VSTSGSPVSGAGSLLLPFVEVESGVQFGLLCHELLEPPFVLEWPPERSW